MKLYYSHNKDKRARVIKIADKDLKDIIAKYTGLDDMHQYTLDKIEMRG